MPRLERADFLVQGIDLLLMHGDRRHQTRDFRRKIRCKENRHVEASTFFKVEKLEPSICDCRF